MGKLSREEWDVKLLRKANGALTLMAALAIVTVVVGCSGDTEEPAEPTQAAPAPTLTAGTSAVAAAPTQAPAAETPTGDPPQPSGDAALSIDQQKERLVAITREFFAGETEENLPRLAIDPDARNHRQGGIQLVIEINGDEYEDVAKNKAELDRWMRDAYEAVFTAGHGLTEATISARMKAVDGRTGITQAVVYRTRLKKETAEEVDWAAKDSLDFNEIWDTLLLNRRWREALGEQSGLR